MLVLAPAARAGQDQAAQQPREIRFRVRVNARTLAWFNKVARPTDVASVHSRDLGLLDQIAVGRKQVLFASAAEAEQLVPSVADEITSIAYDLEHWPATPADEQADPVAAVKRLRALADKYGLSLTLGPDRRFTEEYGAQLAPYADEYILQVQRLQGSPASFASLTNPMIQEVRAANPEIEIVVQLRPDGTAADLMGFVNDLGANIDGVSLLTNAETMDVATEFVSRLQQGVSDVPASGTGLPVVETSATPVSEATGVSLYATPLPIPSPEPAVASGPVAVVAPFPTASQAGERRAVATPTPAAGPATAAGSLPWKPILAGALLVTLVGGGTAVYLRSIRSAGAEARDVTGARSSSRPKDARGPDA